MALSGVHIAFSYPSPTAPGGGTVLPSGAVLSQTMASAGTSTIAAPAGCLLLSVTASASIFYAVGQSPDASNSSSARHYLDVAGGRDDVLVQAGDKVAWILA